MKTRVISTALLFQTWMAGIENVLFPSALSKELNPEDTLDSWGDSLQSNREINRQKTDDFIEKLIESDTPQMLWKALREADPVLTALYYDRIEAATAALASRRDRTELVEIPDSWFSLVLLLLLKKGFQS